jgi:hypothetical protein
MRSAPGAGQRSSARSTRPASVDRARPRERANRQHQEQALRVAIENTAANGGSRGGRPHRARRLQDSLAKRTSNTRATTNRTLRGEPRRGRRAAATAPTGVAPASGRQRERVVISRPRWRRVVALLDDPEVPPAVPACQAPQDRAAVTARERWIPREHRLREDRGQQHDQPRADDGPEEHPIQAEQPGLGGDRARGNRDR